MDLFLQVVDVKSKILYKHDSHLLSRLAFLRAELVAFSKLNICLLRSDSFDCPIPQVVDACKPAELRRDCNNANAERLARLASLAAAKPTQAPTTLDANVAIMRAGIEFNVVDKNAPPAEQVVGMRYVRALKQFF